MDGPRPSSSTAPSIWYAAVAAPQRKPSGKRTGGMVCPCVWRSGCGRRLFRAAAGHPATAAERVDPDRYDEDHPGGDVLDGSGFAEQVEAVLDAADDERAEDRVIDPSPAAEQAGPA